jgi:hypothetical protein
MLKIALFACRTGVAVLILNLWHLLLAIYSVAHLGRCGKALMVRVIIDVITHGGRWVRTFSLSRATWQQNPENILGDGHFFWRIVDEGRFEAYIQLWAQVARV